jgi:hypothetical protein
MVPSGITRLFVASAYVFSSGLAPGFLRKAIIYRELRGVESFE